MDFVNGKIAFTSEELRELREKNPTLFTLAQHLPVNVDVNAHYDSDNFLVVERIVEGSRFMLCPFELFEVKGYCRAARDGEDEPACDYCHCWDVVPRAHVKKYPCWMRRWNDYEHAMQTGSMMWEGEVIE